MYVTVENIEKEEVEKVIIQCHEVTEDINNIIHYIKSSGTVLAGYEEENVTQVFLYDIFFIESVDNRVFAYTAKKVYELKMKLYEFEDCYYSHKFFRCSKSIIINLLQIDYVRPILNGRFQATLFNGEEVIISRQYVSALKKILSGGGVE